MSLILSVLILHLEARFAGFTGHLARVCMCVLYDSIRGYLIGPMCSSFLLQVQCQSIAARPIVSASALSGQMVVLVRQLARSLVFLFSAQTDTMIQEQWALFASCV